MFDFAVNVLRARRNLSSDADKFSALVAGAVRDPSETCGDMAASDDLRQPRCSAEHSGRRASAPGCWFVVLAVAVLLMIISKSPCVAGFSVAPSHA